MKYQQENEKLKEEISSLNQKLNDIQNDFTITIDKYKNKISEYEDNEKEQENTILVYKNIIDNLEKEAKSQNEKNNKDFDEKIKSLQNSNAELIVKQKNLEKEKEKLNKKINELTSAKNKIQMKNQALENEKKILLKSQQSFGHNSNIKDSFPSEFPGMNLKGSIIPEKVPLRKIKEEGDNFDENELGGEYIDDDEDDGNKINFYKKAKEKQIKQSRLKVSLNSNIFDFAEKDDENYVNDLKNEINELYKIRDDMNDQLIQNKEILSKKDEELKQALLKNEELQKIIDKKNNEINQLKNIWDESS